MTSISKLKVLFPLIMLLLFCGCKQPQKHELTFYSDAFNWTLTLPDHFIQVPEARWQKKQQRESSLADPTFYRQTHENSHYIGVFAQNATNYLEASYKTLNSQYYTSYSTEFEDACYDLYDLVQKNPQRSITDTTYSSVTIEGMKFHTFELSLMLADKGKGTIKLYTHIFGDKEFSVIIMSSSAKKELEDCFLKSTFH